MTHLGGVQKFWYDANGNMTTRSEGGVTYSQAWDAENRLTSVTTGSQTTQFFYDGDGTRVKKIEPSGQTTVYVGIHYEKNVTTGVATSYYFVNSSRAALRQGSTVSYLAQDHLGSGNLTLDSSGNKVGELRYKPYGETRYTWGNTPTDRRFTDQRQEASIGLYDYGARFYSPGIGRFISADTIIPQPENPQAWNRYSYVVNNPLKYTDPSGHCFIFCSAAIGAIIGAAVGVVSYGVNALVNHTEFKPEEALLTAGAGAVAGASIGLGIGLISAGGSAVVASAALNAGANTAAATGATLAAGKFDSTNLKINASTAFVAGVGQGLIPGAGNIASAARVGVGALGLGVASELSDAAHGRPVDVNKAQFVAGTGMLIGAVSDRFTSGLFGRSSGTEAFRQTAQGMPGAQFFKSASGLNAGAALGLTTLDAVINRYPANLILTVVGERPTPQ